MLTEHEYRSCQSCAAKLRFVRAAARGHLDAAAGEWTQADLRRLRVLASVRFPNAIRPFRSRTAKVVDVTRRILEQRATVDDPRFASDLACCRADFASADATTLRIYSVVPKQFDANSHEDNGGFRTTAGNLDAQWRGHLEAMAYRVWVVRQQFGERYRVLPFFILPLKDAETSVTKLGTVCDRIHKETTPSASVQKASSTLLRVVSVGDDCLPLVDRVAKNALRLLETFAEAESVRGYHCKKCEALRPCWGKLAEVTPHMFDLNRLWFVGDPSNRSQTIANRLARQGTVALSDVPIDAPDGRYAPRQRLQLRGEALGRELVVPGLFEKLRKVTYPLAALDIENTSSLVPLHPGRVGEIIVFQFAATRQRHAGAPLERHEWLNTRPENPTPQFIEALRAAIGDIGSVLVYSAHEEDSFRQVVENQLRQGNDGDDVRWLREFIDSGRIVDLHQIVFDHWWAPGLGGTTSLKRVLPVLWSMDRAVKLQPPYNEVPHDSDPYSHLKSIGGITNGREAMEIYDEMLGAATPRREMLAETLRRYVAVDAWSMNYVREVLLARAMQAPAGEKVAA